MHEQYLISHAVLESTTFATFYKHEKEAFLWMCYKKFIWILKNQ